MTDNPKHYYQAIATVRGELILDGPHPVLVTNGTTFPAYASKTARKKHRPGQVQNFHVYPCTRHKQAAFQLVNVVETPPTSLTLNGCWEMHKGKPFFIIYRNELFPGHQVLQNLVPVVWEDAPPADGQFWMAEADIIEDKFVITTAKGPFDPPPKATQFVPPSPKAEAAPIAAPAASLPSLTIEEIRAMATSAKISLTCKLAEIPKHRKLADKRIEFFLQDGESDRFFTVQMKPKMFKKLTDHSFEDWIAAITGEIGPATETGFELVNASVQVFEKKAREADTGAEAKPVAESKPTAAEPKPSAVARLEQSAEASKGYAKAEAGVKPKKSKGLLDRVRVG
jgi:hypothetical protein